jgi:predicted ester cyclase
MFRRFVRMPMVGWTVVLLLVVSMILAGCQASMLGAYSVGQAMLTPVTVETTVVEPAAEANKDLILRYFELFNEDHEAAIEEFIEDEVLIHHIEMFNASFPGYQLFADDMIAEGDRIFVRATVVGTHNGDLMGIAPTGNQITLPLALTYDIVDGKIVDHWMYFDQLSLLQQVGAIPAE